jgi:hypothetical protein
MKLGMNLAWAFEEYGQNFGPVFFPPPADGLPTWKNTLPRHLGQIKLLGMSIVRFFILQNGLNYGSVRVDPTGRILNIGLPIPAAPLQLGKKTEFIFDPPKTLHPLFGQHFRLMLETFRDQRMQVIPSLVDFPMLALPPNIFDSSSGGGRTDIAVNDGKRKLFLDTVLEPLLDISVEFKDEIFAWEIMNEPSWLTRRFAPPVGNFGTEEPVMTEAQLTTFLREALDRIEKRPEFRNKSTVGHRFFGDLNNFPTGALPQYHYYGKTAPVLGSDPSSIPPRSQAKNAFIGEFSPEFAASKLHFNALNFEQGAPWPDCNGSDNTNTVIERLKILSRQDYQLALVWPNKADTLHDGNVKLSDEARAFIRNFTGAP